MEAREEADLLRLQLELAQQEEAAAKRALAASQAALAAALAAPDDLSDDAPDARDDVSGAPAAAQKPCREFLESL